MNVRGLIDGVKGVGETILMSKKNRAMEHVRRSVSDRVNHILQNEPHLRQALYVIAHSTREDVSGLLEQVGLHMLNRDDFKDKSDAWLKSEGIVSIVRSKMEIISGIPLEKMAIGDIRLNTNQAVDQLFREIRDHTSLSGTETLFTNEVTRVSDNVETCFSSNDLDTPVGINDAIGDFTNLRQRLESMIRHTPRTVKSDRKLIEFYESTLSYINKILPLLNTRSRLITGGNVAKLTANRNRIYTQKAELSKMLNTQFDEIDEIRDEREKNLNFITSEYAALEATNGQSPRQGGVIKSITNWFKGKSALEMADTAQASAGVVKLIQDVRDKMKDWDAGADALPTKPRRAAARASS